MDALSIAAAGALIGAAAGSLGTWAVSRLRDHELARASEGQTLKAKIHDLEIRMVRMETELGYYAGMAVQRFEGVGRAHQS